MPDIHIGSLITRELVAVAPDGEVNMTIAPAGQGVPHPVSQPQPAPPAKPERRAAGAAASPVTEAPDTSVMVGGLAAALKGDALHLFSSISDEDRRTLGGYVASGAMTGEELNDALNDRLKAGRGRVIRDAWAAEDAARPQAERDADQKRSADTVRLMLEMEDIDRQVEKLWATRDKKAIAALNAQRAEKQMQYSALSGSKGEASSLVIYGDFAVEKLYRSDGERAAGDKLTAVGFGSESFDRTVADIAAGDVAASQRGRARSR